MQERYFFRKNDSRDNDIVRYNAAPRTFSLYNTLQHKWLHFNYSGPLTPDILIETHGFKEIVKEQLDLSLLYE